MALHSQPEEVKNDGLRIGDVQKMILNKPHFYQAVVANGWYLPGLHTTICTQTFLTEVRSGACYVPRIEDTRFRPCLFPPT